MKIVIELKEERGIIIGEVSSTYNYTESELFKIINNHLEVLQETEYFDINNISKIIITDRLINLVTKK